LTFEECEERSSAGWNVDQNDCCDYSSGQRKRYVRAGNERLASLSSSQAHGTGSRASKRTPCLFSGCPSSSLSDSRLGK